MNKKPSKTASDSKDAKASTSAASKSAASKKLTKKENKEALMDIMKLIEDPGVKKQKSNSSAIEERDNIEDREVEDTLSYFLKTRSGVPASSSKGHKSDKSVKPRKSEKSGKLSRKSKKETLESADEEKEANMIDIQLDDFDMDLYNEVSYTDVNDNSVGDVNADEDEDTFSIDEDDLLSHIMDQKMKDYEKMLGSASSENKNTDNVDNSDESSQEQRDAERKYKDSEMKKKKKHIVFKDPTKKLSRDQVGKLQTTVPTTIKELKNLKRKHVDELGQLQKERRERKRAKYNPETYLKEVDPYTQEMMKFRFEMKKTLLRETMTQDEYDLFLKEELDKQGKVWKGKIKNEHRNYKELKQEIMDRKESRMEERAKAMMMGALTKEDLKREKKEKERKYRLEQEKFQLRFGNPHALGREENSKLFRNQAYNKGFGKYRDGALILSKREIGAVAKKK